MNDTKTPFQCLTCKSIFSSKYSLLRHNDRKHSIDFLKTGATNTNHTATNTNHTATNTNHTATNTNHTATNTNHAPSILTEEIGTIKPFIKD